MTDVAIRVENLAKRYHIGKRLRYRTLRDSIADAMVSPFRRLASQGRKASNGDRHENVKDDYIWALEDISFEIKHGEVVGIIGRNGAGKSTLLRVLARITEPTKGYARIHGRVGSLLEVGTAFHSELTGRENVFLNGAILGMKRSEIARKFDEIVDFAAVEKFIDTPVKHYSDGMYMRLAFAVAAHLEPEILLVDEVLAVGDVEFQKKCLGKMDEVAKHGRTVLFVTHNMGSLANLCPRSILLVNGHKFQDGPTSQVIGTYLAMQKQTQGERIWQDLPTAPGNDRFRIQAVRIVSGGSVCADVDIEKEIDIEIDFWNFQAGSDVITSLHLTDKVGVSVLASMNTPSANLITDDWSGRPRPIGLFRAVCTLPGNFLNEGRYTLSIGLQTNVTQIEAVARDAVSFTVYETGAMRKEYGGRWDGVVRPRLAWKTAYLRAESGEFSEVKAD